MKNTKQTQTIFLFLFIVFNLQAQLSLSPQMSYIKLGGDSDVNSLGLGLKIEFGKDGNSVLYGGGNYYLSGKILDITEGLALSSSTSPSYIDIDVVYDINIVHLFLGGKRYLLGNYEEDNFGLYFMVEGGYMLMPITTKLSSYDKTLYASSIEDGAKETLSGLTLAGGIGVEKYLGMGFAFAEAKYNFPANQVNGLTVSVDIPSSLNFNVGLRIPFYEMSGSQPTKSKAKSKSKRKSKK
jgi:hypothetical protein